MKHNVAIHDGVLPQPNDNAFIYALVDPRTGYIRYVGKAVDTERRYKDHFSKYELARNTRKVNWIKSLLACELKPSLILLEETHKTSWQEAERRWIAFYRSIPGYPELTNGTSGGDGAEKGSKHKPESLEKMRLAHSTPERKEKSSISSRKRPKRKSCTSKFVGVSWSSKDQRWRVSAMVNKKTIELGYFLDEIDGAHARDRFICRHFPSLGIPLNFPEFDYSTHNSTESRLYTRNKSGYRGVSWGKEKRLWVALFRYKGIKRIRYFEGTATGKIEAARFYDKWSLRIYGIFAKTNFPFSEYTQEDINDDGINPLGRKPSASGYRGVYWVNRDQNWAATVIVQRRNVRLGGFPDTEEGKIEAAHAYDRWVIQHCGPTAYTNFPRSSYD